MKPLQHLLINQHRIDALHVRQHHQLLQSGGIFYITHCAGVGPSPLSSRHAKQGHIQQIGFAGIKCGGLRLGQLTGNQVFFDGVCVDAVVDLGQGPAGNSTPESLRGPLRP